MPFAALVIGAILVVVAFNNSFSALASELETDAPGYFKWALAITAICALGYIPGLRTPSRYLLALVALVLLLKNYAQIYAGFTSFSSSGGTATAGQGQANPTASYVATYAPAAAGATTTTAAANPSVSLFGGLLTGKINLGSTLFGTGGAANPATGSAMGLGN